MNLNKWAIQWGIASSAIADLKRQMGLEGTTLTAESTASSEAGAAKRIRLEAARHGIILWRNNVGVALQDENGRHVRYGLANDSMVMNKRIKSSDLVGLKPDGQFVCREVKRPGWTFTGTEREVAQRKFIELVLSKGGDAAFATGYDEEMLV